MRGDRSLQAVYAETGKPWLFDLEKDPDEMENRFAEPPASHCPSPNPSSVEYAEEHKDDHYAKPNVADAMKAVLAVE